MATKFYFNGKQRILPGAYSTIVSGDDTVTRSLDYGKVLVIHTGKDGEDWGGGSGIDGTFQDGQRSVYSFTSLADFQSFVKGGMWYKWAEALFRPDPTNTQAAGVSTLYFVRAAKTTPAKMTYTVKDNADVFVFQTRDEGSAANGVLTTDKKTLTKGYAYEVVTAGTDSFVMRVYLGTFTGNSMFDNLPINDVDEDETTAELVWQSDSFANVKDLLSIAQKDSTFNSLFVIDSTATKAGSIKAVAATLGDTTLAKGGVTTYDSTSTANLEKVMAAVADSDYNAVVSDLYGDDILDTAKSGVGPRQKVILTSIAQDSRYRRFLWLAGKEGSADFNDSISAAAIYNSDYVQIVHGAAGLSSLSSPQGYRWWGSQYMMCAVLGRCVGKPPYIPVTNKSVGVDYVKYMPTVAQQEKALEKGVILVINSLAQGKFVVLQGVNTLQDNSRLFNAKGQSFSIQFMRIVDQLNRELVYNAEIDLLSSENGVNVNTLSPNILIDWTKSYLNQRVATSNEDNLILGFKDVTATRKDDAYFVSYYIRVNNEITKLFFTGFLLR